MTSFSQEEQPLLTGTDEEIAAFIDADRCIVLDWKAAEEDTLWNVQQCLPEGVFDFQIAPESASMDLVIAMRFRDREKTFTFPPRPQNCFRVLFPVRDLLLPEYEIKLFCSTEGDDTHALLLRPAQWWAAFRKEYHDRYATIFCDLDILTNLWELDAPAKPSVAVVKPARPWWKLW